MNSILENLVVFSSQESRGVIIDFLTPFAEVDVLDIEVVLQYEFLNSRNDFETFTCMKHFASAPQSVVA